MRRVAVTGLGVVSPMGTGRETFFRGLREGRSGLGPIRRFNAGGLAATRAGEVPGLEELKGRLVETRGHLPPIGGSTLRETLDRDAKIAFALAAADEAMEDGGVLSLGAGTLLHLGASLETFSLGSVGPVKGKSLPEIERLMTRASLRTPLDRACALIELKHGRAGLSLTNCSACAAGLQALGQAFRAVARGGFERALAGAFDSLINPLGVGGFQLLGALAPDDPEPGPPLCRPFDKDRRGLVMGEGAAVMVLEPLDKALAEGRKIYGEILGYGASLDAASLSAPDPAGSGAYRSMEAALRQAGLRPEEVDHLSAHGTGTLLNDPAEAAAVRRLFPNWQKMPAAAVKSMTGHAIAAAGALEAAACLMTLGERLVPPNIGLRNVGADCELDHVMGEARKFEGNIVATNSFGFGGQNATMIFRGLG
ncbi:MAG: beta-ketoacyl-[acyl-carrier-protein] synthase family protein [Deltaproteobacteria bacterium]|nr:beta-ketoacyl-[acyl-carrier-protein] synthase family protein [Deltaproteobacteria bacterium]